MLGFDVIIVNNPLSLFCVCVVGHRYYQRFPQDVQQVGKIVLYIKEQVTTQILSFASNMWKPCCLHTNGIAVLAILAILLPSLAQWQACMCLAVQMAPLSINISGSRVSL